MLDPIQELMDEHRIIEKVLTALEAAAEQEVSLEFYEQAVDFIVNFADKCHHGKEEDRLFPVLEEKGIPRQSGPIGCMCDEHEIARELVRSMRELLSAGDLPGLRRESLEYTALLRSHIQKEDNVLFPMGRNALSEGDLAQLRAKFDEVEHPKQCHCHYTKVAEQLLAEVGVTAQPALGPSPTQRAAS